MSNLGAANPLGAGRLARDIAGELGCPAASRWSPGTTTWTPGSSRARAWKTVHLWTPVAGVSANAYLGADAITPALATGADVILTGRVADPSLFVAPLADRLGWDLSAPATVANGTLVGHLLECGTQLTGGDFADPGRKDVPDLATLGYPWAEVSPQGKRCSASSPARADCLIGVPSASSCCMRSLTPAPTSHQTFGEPDLSGVTITEIGADRVRVVGAVVDLTRPAQGECRLPGWASSGSRHLLRRTRAASTEPDWPVTWSGTGSPPRARDCVSTSSEAFPTAPEGEVAQCWLRVAGLTWATRRGGRDLPRDRVALHLLVCCRRRCSASRSTRSSASCSTW